MMVKRKIVNNLGLTGWLGVMHVCDDIGIIPLTQTGRKQTRVDWLIVKS